MSEKTQGLLTFLALGSLGLCVYASFLEAEAESSPASVVPVLLFFAYLVLLVFLAWSLVASLRRLLVSARLAFIPTGTFVLAIMGVLGSLLLFYLSLSIK